MQKTTMVTKEQAHAARKWYVIDATGIPLGRMATHAANLLRGKLKPDFTPNQDCGDYVVIINASKVVLTGNKAENEKWYDYSGYKGGLRSRTGAVMLDKFSDELVERAIKGMLPKNRLSDQIFTKLHVYKYEKHDHEAQAPAPTQVPGVRKQGA